MNARTVLPVLLLIFIAVASSSVLGYRLANIEWTPEQESQYTADEVPWYYEGPEEVRIAQSFSTEGDSSHPLPANNVRFTGSSNNRYPDYFPYRGEFFMNQQRAKNFLHNDYVRPTRLVKDMTISKVGNKYVYAPMGLGATRNYMFPGAITCMVESGINRFRWTFEGKRSLDEAKQKFGKAYFNCFN